MEKGMYITAQIAKWEKYGIAEGIGFTLRDRIRALGRKMSEWSVELEFNGYTHKYHEITFVVPTPEDIKLALDLPHFFYCGSVVWIDMINFNDEINVHFMEYNKSDKWTNKGWHTVQESLSLEDTMVLYEYILNQINNMFPLEKEDSDKYNITGAIGVITK